MKRIMSICLIIVLLMNFIPMNVIAATQQSYEVSDTINATLSSDGVLTISGSGEMPDYTERKLAPWNGENIKKVIVEKGITVIGNYAFYNMPSITEVELVEGLIEIGLSAFTNTSLKIVTIPASVTDIGTDAFVSTTIEEYKVAEGNPSFSTDEGALYEKIKDYTYMQYFPPKSDLTTYTIPDGVISISQNCFANAKNLQKINIPDSVTMIQAYAFANSGITSITIPEVILEVYSPNVFENCTELKTVNFYAEIDNVITNESKLPSGTFRNCTSLTEVNFKGVIEDSHQPNGFGNGGLLKLKADSVILKGASRPVNAKVIRANDKIIFFNNIKGKRGYIRGIGRVVDKGENFYKKSRNTSKKLADNPVGVIISPIPTVVGAVGYAVNLVASPVTALWSKGDHISLPAGTNYVIKLKEHAYIY